MFLSRFEGTLVTAAALGVIEIMRKTEHLVQWIVYKLTGRIQYYEKKEINFIAQFNNGLMVVDKIGTKGEMEGRNHIINSLLQV